MFQKNYSAVPKSVFAGAVNNDAADQIKTNLLSEVGVLLIKNLVMLRAELQFVFCFVIYYTFRSFVSFYCCF